MANTDGEFLRFLASERRRATVERVAAAAIVLALGGALVYTLAFTRNETSSSDNSALAARVATLETKVDELLAEQRTLSSQSSMRARARSDAETIATPSRKEGAPPSLAAKPVDDEPDADDRARRVGNEAMARALERVNALPTFDEAPAVPQEPAAATTAPSAAAEPAPSAPPDEIVEAFNKLLRDAGLDGWRLMNATASAEDHALTAVVLAHRTDKGTATGSLSAERLVLERDPLTGVAAFVLKGAHGVEDGVEIAYPDATYRLEVPGVLPLELIGSELAKVFGVGMLPPDLAAKSPTDSKDVVRAINVVLAREKDVALRVRTIEKLEGEKLKKAVIDLAFDDHGEPVQTVLADEAWFELDTKARSGELCCEGGEMVENGQKRPLFRNRLRISLRELTPAQWRGVPAVKPASGS